LAVGIFMAALRSCLASFRKFIVLLRNLSFLLLLWDVVVTLVTGCPWSVALPLL